MKVKCIGNTGQYLCSKKRMSQLPTCQFDLSLQRVYNVYGMSLWKGRLDYLILGDANYPGWYESELFEVVDECLPSDWKFAFWENPPKINITAIWGYQELLDDKYVEDLTLGQTQALKVFFDRKKQYDLQYTDPSVTQSVRVLQTRWIMCPNCTEAWEDNSVREMICCPKCEAILLNNR